MVAVLGMSLVSIVKKGNCKIKLPGVNLAVYRRAE